MHQKKHLSFNGLVGNLSGHLNLIEDPRQSGKIEYSLHDCCMSSFAMMFFQDPSMLEFQTRLEEKHNLNNLKTLFNVDNIPKSSQLREVVDNVPSDNLEIVFKDFFKSLQRGKQLELFRFLNGKYLIPLDGTQEFSSDKIHCRYCLTKKHRTGKITYHHQVLCGAVVHPDYRQVIPIAPEPI